MKFRAPYLIGSILLLASLQAVSANPVNLQVLGISNTNPSPGTSISVTVAFCDDTAFAANRVKLIAGFRAGAATTFIGCPAAGQYYAVDTSIAGGIASGPGMYDTGNGGTQGGSGPPYYPSYNSGATPSCPTGSVTAVWSIYIDGNFLTPGPYSFIVGAAEDYVNCTNASAYASASLTVPLPPAAFTLNKRAEIGTAAPSGLVLFDIDYSFVNTNNFVITDIVPANLTYVGASGGGSYSAGTVTWNMGNASTPKTGTVWFLARVNAGTPVNTVITNQVSGVTNEVGFQSSNAAVTVQLPQLTLNKSQSSASLAAGSIVTYNLDWTSNGQTLQLFDSYNNVSTGSSTSGAAVPWGYDGTNYTIAPANAANGTWTVQTDANGDHYIDASVAYDGSGASGHNPGLVRDVPGLNICSDFTVLGDLQIPLSAPGAGVGADAHMILAMNPSQGITLKAAISIDAFPGNLFVQKNNIYPLPAGAATSALPFSVVAGVWYTMKVRIQSNGSGTIAYTVQLWQRSNPSLVGTLVYTDATAPQPTCSGGWRQGWQVDETAGRNWFSNLKVLGSAPVVNAAVTDVVPPGITYVGASVAPSSGPSPLVWNFPATIFSFDTLISWWGQVSCPGPISNQFSMVANGIPATVSNTTNLAVTNCAGVPTNTPTFTPTFTRTFTPTFTPTFTFTPTPTTTGTISPTNTPTITPTFTNTPTVTPTTTVVVRIEVFDSLSNSVKVISIQNFSQPPPNLALSSNLINAFAGPGSTTNILSGALVIGIWDATNALALPVPDGIYSIHVDVTNSLGVTTTTNLQVTVARVATPTPTATLPNVDIFYASKNVFKPSDGPVSIHVEYSKFPGNYQLWVYNTAGEHIRTLDSQQLTARMVKSYEWDGKNKNGEDCSSGVYILYLIEPFDRKYKRLLLIR